jgi:alginate O-acetyltransferase complex protein AlgI
MLFNSFPFIFCFLPITLIGFFCLNRWHLTQLAQIWLVIASIAFYSYWSITYLPLLLISILVNYQIGKRISDAILKSRKAQNLLWLGVCFNFGLLAYYKYANFFVTTIEKALNTNWHLSEIILPLGISFYTFTQTAYLVDAYRGETKNYNFWNYSLFVTFFPHLIAGPILHHSDTIPQFYRLRNLVISHQNMAIGITWFVLGLFKKVIIADTVAPWVSPIFNHASSVSFLEAWVGALSYTLQLYFDFSGYSDMAVGLGFMLNIQIPINFNSPYKSTSIIDFWRRWHISLSNFLRDYLYIPLGGSRRGEIRRYTNLFVTMLLGGLWHGAGWTFIIWGGLHGTYLCINHGWRKLNKPLPKFIAWTITFVAVILSWVLFRSHNIIDAIELLKTMVGLKGIALTEGYQISLQWLTAFGVKFQRNYPYLPGKDSLIILIGLMLWVVCLPNTQEIVKWFQPQPWWAVGLSVIAIYCLLSLNKVSEFLYFQF